VVPPFKGKKDKLPEFAQIYNKEVGRRRILIENVFSRVKLWKILTDFSFSRSKHEKIFRAIIQIIQVLIIFKPLRANFLFY